MAEHILSKEVAQHSLSDEVAEAFLSEKVADEVTKIFLKEEALFKRW